MNDIDAPGPVQPLSPASPTVTGQQDVPREPSRGTPERNGKKCPWTNKLYLRY